MGRFWFGTVLMALLLAVGLYSATAIGNSQDPIAVVLEQAADTTDQNAAEALLQKAKAYWDDHWRTTAILTDHGPMDEIDSLFAQAEAYVRSANMEDFSAFCLRLSQRIRAIAEGQKPTWWNFL